MKNSLFSINQITSLASEIFSARYYTKKKNYKVLTSHQQGQTVLKVCYLLWKELTALDSL